MFFDWIGQEGGAIFLWWLATLVAGIAVYPLCYRLMGALPSRGYPLARAAGIMLIGFLFWILNILGLLRNTPAETLLVAVLVFVIGVISYFSWRDREPILDWLREHLSLIIMTELVFLVMFVGWATVRALNPDLSATEHPMDMAFLSASRRSATFPPNDPWMAGYAISYYHFGYILMAMLANVTNVSNGMAYNLAIALLFALTSVGVFGVAYDLVAVRFTRKTDKSGEKVKPTSRGLVIRHPQALLIGVVAVIFVMLLGNLGIPAVEIPYQTKTISRGYMTWIDLKYRQVRPPDQSNPDYVQAGDCIPSGSADPAKWCFWWWFAYARMINDHDLSGTPLEVITETPSFSFVLADMHPHVLALPFAVLAIGLGLNLVLMWRRLDYWEFLLYAIFVGGMAFLNSWDAVYLGLIIGAEALRRLMRNGTGRYTAEDWRGMVIFAVGLIGLTAILYSPFFISFRSQAGGILPNLLWPTEFHQFFLLFGPFLFILSVFLILELRRARRTFNWTLVTQAFGAAVALIVVVVVLFSIIAWLKPDVQGLVFDQLNQSGGLLGGIAAVLVRRVQGIVTELFLLAMILIVVGRLFARPPQTADGTPAPAKQIITDNPATGYALLLIAAGAVLTLGPDFVYLRDGFGTRMNTVFKLYYQGWVLWGIASAYAVWSILRDPIRLLSERPLRFAFVPVTIILLIAGMIYEPFAVVSRAFAEPGRIIEANPNDPNSVTMLDATKPLTLDGGRSLARNDDDYKMIQCLAQVARSDKDVVAEAIIARIGYRQEYGRVSGLTGIPTVIGWENHEGQWRGDTFDQTADIVYNEFGQRIDGRVEAVARLYNDVGWTEAIKTIKRYNITYIYVGPTERQTYQAAGLAKFEQLTPVCSVNDNNGKPMVAVYSTADILTQQVAS